MNALLQITAVNAACATLLALIVALTARFITRPAVSHALWILVLLQLFMPPVIEIGLLPGPGPQEPTSRAARTIVEPGPALNRPVAREAHASNGAPNLRTAKELALPTAGSSPGMSMVLTTTWVTGSSWVLILFGVRSYRFRRLLRCGGSTNAALERRLAGLAKRMGVSSPSLRLVRAPISPLIHPRLGGAELLFPSGLLRRLNAGEQDAILAHELAHVARRDHWVRLLELIAAALFWWHPAVWWARSRLRLAEERCCDQIVMQTLPRERSSYARGLLKTVEFLAGTTAGVPALASGVGEVHDLKERLTMILKGRPPKSMSKTRRLLLTLCAASMLLIFPTWSERDLQAAPASGAEQESADEIANAEAERDFVEERLKLTQQAMELEQALREIREQQAELEQVWRSEMSSRDPARREAARARADADRAYARAGDSYERALAARRSAEREQREYALLREQARQEAEVQYALQHKLLELERADLDGDHDRAAGLRLEIAELEKHLRKSRLERELDRGRREEVRFEASLDRLRAEAHEQREAGRDEAAERLERELEALREQLLEERILREQEIQRLLEEVERSGGAGIVR